LIPDPPRGDPQKSHTCNARGAARRRAAPDGYGRRAQPH
jgi:hypothetical protein